MVATETLRNCETISSSGSFSIFAITANVTTTSALSSCILIASILFSFPSTSNAAGAFVGGDISWKTCQNNNVESRFYDPLFPEVCLQCTRSLCIGATIRASFSTKLEYGSSRFLTNLEQDVANFKAGISTVLRLDRNMGTESLPSVDELKIGYRRGLGDTSTVPDVTKSRSGLIDCTGESVANDLYVLNVVYFRSLFYSFYVPIQFSNHEGFDEHTDYRFIFKPELHMTTSNVHLGTYSEFASQFRLTIQIRPTNRNFVQQNFALDSEIG
ncbi:hypothetical protein GUITHDRAFT_120481 [Guillardia theta CCMP2712]|uniref:Uncharacterized protein n=1 Tax=Guillardia theta (strain CCMP2712) TaxID=905079 RepID=L1IBW6_GUITC|nr:hypothetical protein GUITHDRAFT_120481 [Guillardia theta CCMP2712]EKX33315.1 hypothetical protein GUITHDRAFT_120481 [Guillardia theta CCMP2712]|eukprot:XP_005820295.1 hypothetical protein GUITHDRAFT_120481 [Guillardia theta CCMP2712]